MRLIIGLVFLFTATSAFAKSEIWNVAVVFLDGNGSDPILSEEINKNLSEINSISQNAPLALSVYRQSSGQDLRLFLKQAFELRDSKYRMLFIYGHGEGYKGFKTLDTRAFKKDLDVFQSDKSQPFFDVIWYDSCYMGNLEFLYEMRRYSKYQIASQDSEFTSGFPFYSLSLSASNRFHSVEQMVRALAYKFVESYSFIKKGEQSKSVVSSSSVITVIENEQLESLVELISQYSTKAFSNLAPLPFMKMEDPRFIDLASYLHYLGIQEVYKLLGDPESTQVLSQKNSKAETDFWIRYRVNPQSPIVFVGATDVGNPSYSRYSGLSIANPFLPLKSLEYYNLEFNLKTGWIK